MATVHGNLMEFSDLKAQVHCSRGISLTHGKIRRSPNCFNFCRQIDVLKRGGEDQDFFKEPWT